MIVSRTTGTQPLLLFAAIAAAGLAVIVAGIYFFPLTIDEAYITYSHARNFARSGRLVYHPANPEFSVSTPLYALLLGLGGAVGIPIPALSKLLGAASIFGSSVYLSLLCYRHRMIWAALTSGLLLATSPLLWQTLGLEYCFLLLLVLAALYHSDRGHYVAAAVLAACAVLTRWEGIFAAAILGLSCFILVALRHGASQKQVIPFLLQLVGFILFVGMMFSEYPDGDYVLAAINLVLIGGAVLYQVLFAEEEHILQIGLPGIYRQAFVQQRTGWKVVAVLFVILAPVLLYGAVSNGTPVPMALMTQQGHGAAGFTGYGLGTSFLQGLLTTLRASLDQSPLHYLWLPLGIFGIHLLWSGTRKDADVSPLQEPEPAAALPADLQESRGSNQSTWWIWAVLAWGGLHIGGYFLLKLSPYPWSLVPLVPGIVVLAGLAVQRLAEWVGKGWLQVLAAGTLLLLLLLAQLILIERTITSVSASHPPAAAHTSAAPTGGGQDLYWAAAEWIKANTPVDATVAASRSGIIGYYAERTMIDLSGSMQVDVAQALKRGDPFYAILALLPQYLVLEDSHFIFRNWQKGNSWFTAHYYVAKRFTDEHLETLGGPTLVVLRRLDDVRPWDNSIMSEDDWTFGFAISYSLGLKLFRTVIYGSELLPGSWMHVRLECEVEDRDSPLPFRAERATSFILTDMNSAIVAEQPLESAMTAFYNRNWREKERFPIYVHFYLPEDLTPGTYYLQILSVEEETEDESIIQFARVSVGNSSKGWGQTVLLPA